MNEKKKVAVYMSIITVILVLIGVLASFNRSDNDVKANNETKTNIVKKESTMKERISIELLSNKEPDFLNKNITQQKIDNFEKKIAKLKNEKEKKASTKMLEVIQTKFDKQNKVNSLFTQKAIIGEKVSEFSLTDKALMNERENTKKLVKSEMTKDTKDKFYVSVNQVLKKADEQVQNVEKVENLFHKIKDEQENKISEGQKKELTALISTIKNHTVKNTFSNKLNDLEIITKEELVKVEEKVQQEKQQAESVKNQGTENSAQSQSQQNQNTIEGIISNSPTAQRTNQIVGVVANGSSAQVYLFENNGNGWQTITRTYGHVGSQGVGQASEYVSRTPLGSYSLGFAFGTSNPGTQLPFRQITQNSYWISNVNDGQYNTWQERPNGSDSADEHLIDYPVQYQYGIVINYNAGVGGGSGFFLHCDNGMATAGCVSVPTATMQMFMQRIHSGAYIINVNSVNALANY